MKIALFEIVLGEVQDASRVNCTYLIELELNFRSLRVARPHWLADISLDTFVDVEASVCCNSHICMILVIGYVSYSFIVDLTRDLLLLNLLLLNNPSVDLCRIFYSDVNIAFTRLLSIPGRL